MVDDAVLRGFRGGIITIERRREIRWACQRHGEDVVVATTGNLVVYKSRLLLAATLDGCGLGYVTRWIAADALANQRLRQVLAEWTALPWSLPVHQKHSHLGGHACVSRLSEVPP